MIDSGGGGHPGTTISAGIKFDIPASDAKLGPKIPPEIRFN
jgi:hypothetical protein